MVNKQSSVMCHCEDGTASEWGGDGSFLSVFLAASHPAARTVGTRSLRHCQTIEKEALSTIGKIQHSQATLCNVEPSCLPHLPASNLRRKREAARDVAGHTTPQVRESAHSNSQIDEKTEARMCM